MHQELKADTNRCTLMMKRAISVVLFLISVKAVPGQSLSGTVTDTGDVPVPYASVIILSVPDSSFVSGTACDSAGRFDIAKSVTSGLLWVSSVGYRDRYLHFGSGTSGFGTVRLETEAGLIRNAAVTASMPLVQVRGNAMETIVEGSRLERAGTGEDLLSKIPGISVKDGKVSVFGGGSITEVYINGRLVRNDTDLGRLESADVRSVELVRNPGARYKASAGSVIRIFTKKNKDEGFSLDNRAEIYNRFKWTASDQLGLSYRKGGMEITGSMFGRYMNHSDNKTAVEETFSDKVMTSVTAMYAPQKWVYLSPNMSFNYMFDERNSAGVRYEFSNDSGYARYDNSQSILFDGRLSELADLGIDGGFGDTRHRSRTQPEIQDVKEFFVYFRYLQIMINPEHIVGRMADKLKTAFIGSVDESGYPNIKAMLQPRKREGIKVFYFTTNTSSMRVSQFRADNRACVYFCDSRFFRGVMLRGQMEILTDTESRQMIWRDGDTKYYPGGISDPDYCVLKFTAMSGRYYGNFVSEEFDVD